MIIFGTRFRDSTVASGTFLCPRCSAQRPYSHKVVKQWFTLYFVPVIPMGRRGEYIECGVCAGTYGAEVLHYAPDAERAEETAITLRRIASLTLGEAGRIWPATVSTLCELIGDDSCSEANVHEDWSLAQQAGARVLPFARSKAQNMTEEGRVLAAWLCIQALCGGGPLDERCLAVLRQLAEGLLLSENALQQLLSRKQGSPP